MASTKAGSPVAKIVVTLACAAAAGGGHLAARTEEPAYYFVDDLYVAGLRPNAGKELRVHGFVVPDSVTRAGDVTAFAIAYGGMRLAVTAASPPPEAIRPHADVIVTGRLVEGEPWRLAGSVVVARCGGYRDARPEPARFQ